MYILWLLLNVCLYMHINAMEQNDTANNSIDNDKKKIVLSKDIAQALYFVETDQCTDEQKKCKKKDRPVAKLFYISQKKWVTHQLCEDLIFPTTSYIYPVKAVFTNNSWLPDTIINPEQNTAVFPHEQLWVDCASPRPYYLRLSNDINVSDDKFWDQGNDDYEYGYPNDIITFDGTNQHNIGIAATEKYIYLVKKTVNDKAKQGTALQKNHGKVQSLTKIDGKLLCMSLDPEKNRFIFCTQKSKQNILHIRDIDVERSLLGNVSYQATSIIQEPINQVFKKIINLGNTKKGKEEGLGEVYLGILQNDTSGLYTFWHDQHNKLQYAKQTVKWKNSEGFIKDIAVDNTVKTESGFKPRITVLSKTSSSYDRYLLDFIAFKDPKLLFIESEEMKSEIDHFSYNAGICTKISFEDVSFRQTYDYANLFIFTKLLQQNNWEMITNGIVKDISVTDDQPIFINESNNNTSFNYGLFGNYFAKLYVIRSFFTVPFSWVSTIFSFFNFWK